MKYIATVISKSKITDREFTLAIKAKNKEMARKDLFNFYKISEVIDIVEYDKYNFINKNNRIKDKINTSFFNNTKYNKNFV